MTNKPKTMRILITVQVLEDDTPTPPQQPAQDAAQTDLSRFVRLEDLPGADDGVECIPVRSVAFREPRAPNTTTRADKGQQHPRYGTGRKVHTCSNCGAPNRHFNTERGHCGAGPDMCFPAGVVGWLRNPEVE
jgi:hypothetical protein